MKVVGSSEFAGDSICIMLLKWIHCWTFKALSGNGCKQTRIVRHIFWSDLKAGGGAQLENSPTHSAGSMFWSRFCCKKSANVWRKLHVQQRRNYSTANRSNYTLLSPEPTAFGMCMCHKALVHESREQQYPAKSGPSQSIVFCSWPTFFSQAFFPWTTNKKPEMFLIFSCGKRPLSLKKKMCTKHVYIYIHTYYTYIPPCWGSALR